jgi:hypothetical protein
VGVDVYVIQCAWVGVNECGYGYVCDIDTDVSVGVRGCMGMDLGIGVNTDATNIVYWPIGSRFRL